MSGELIPRGPMRLRVELTEAEHAECFALAAARTEAGAARGQGEGSQTSQSHSGSQVDLGGVEGEWAFSKGVLPEFQRPRGAGVDDGWDFWINGFEVDVKTALGPNRNFLVAAGRVLKAQAGVHVECLSCRTLGGDVCAYLVVGWLLQYEWRERHVDASGVRDDLSGSLYWREWLRPINTFLPWLESKGVLAGPAGGKHSSQSDGSDSVASGEVEKAEPAASDQQASDTPVDAAGIGVVW